MKQIKIHLPLLFVVMLFFSLTLTACGDFLESSSSGKLTGQWQLMAVDTLATGGHLDVKADRKYLCVEDRLLELRDADESIAERGYLFRYTHEGGKLSVYDARFNLRPEGDPAIEDVDLLRPFGFNSLTEQFEISLDDKQMTLTSATLRLTLRKF